MTNEHLSKILSYYNKHPSSLLHEIGNIYRLKKEYKFKNGGIFSLFDKEYDNIILTFNTFYLIKIGNNYVGIIYNMGYDIHAFTAKKYRKNGYMTNALILLAKHFKNYNWNEYSDENWRFTITAIRKSGIALAKKISKYYKVASKEIKYDVPF